MTLPHHDTTHRNERRGRKSPLFGAEEAGHSDITASAKLAVGLHGYTTAQVVQDQGLVRLRETKLPWQAGMLNACPPRRASSTIVARDEDVVSLGLGHAARDNANSNLRHQLH